MRVLWFTNSPSLASELLLVKSNSLGWVESLQKEIITIQDIVLGVVFPFNSEDEKQFSDGKTTYYSFPYPKDKKGIPGLINRWKHLIENEEIISFHLKAIEDFKPDIIHIFGTESAYGLIIPRIKIPVVIQIQGNLTLCVKKWYSGLDSFDILRYTSLKSFLKGYGLWHLYHLTEKRANRERKIMQFCSYFIGRTDWDRRITKVLAPQSKYFHCEELLRAAFMNATSWDLQQQQKAIIHSTVNSLLYKGLETILETSHLLNRNKLYEFEWHVAGVTGKEEIIQVIEKKFKLRFSDQNVVFRGSLNVDQLILALSNSHVYVHPSHIENSPNSVCEAMVIGMPVIATFAGGTSSMIKDSEEGILVQDGDPYVMAGAITELLQDSKKMNHLAANAKKRARERHDKTLVINRMSEIYQQIVQIDQERHNISQ